MDVASSTHPRVKPELVIFDCDGVLVDSEPIANRVLAECLTELGLHTTAEDAARDYMGASLETCISRAEAKLGRALPADFRASFRGRVFAAFERELTPIPHVAEAVAQLVLPHCVASNSHPDWIRATLRRTGLLPLFEGRIFSAEQVQRGKPHPDLFLHAARSLGKAPETCVVIEDTTVGVAAAVAAGMPVLGFAQQNDPQALETAGARVFDDMRALPALLAELGTLS
ncbi:MAG: HAD family hydrolase [Proteobacteria bacterium]|nr:HAD family hydrolase [Pseudomonadota bacterium]